MPNRIKHVVYADDDPDDHELFSSIITVVSPGVTVSQFYRCDILIDYLNDENRPLPDLIFLDYNMPGNDGNECLRTLKKTARTLHIPIVIYSTSDYSKFVEEAYKQGAYKYILKPSDYAEMKQTIKTVIMELEQGDQGLLNSSS